MFFGYLRLILRRIICFLVLLVDFLVGYNIGLIYFVGFYYFVELFFVMEIKNYVLEIGFLISVFFSLVNIGICYFLGIGM